MNNFHISLTYFQRLGQDKIFMSRQTDLMNRLILIFIKIFSLAKESTSNILFTQNSPSSTHFLLELSSHVHPLGIVRVLCSRTLGNELLYVTF